MDAILYRSRDTSAVTMREVRRIVREAEGRQVFVVTYSPERRFDLISDVCPIHETFRENLEKLPYGKSFEKINWNSPVGHNGLPLFELYSKFPYFKNYWVIEDDVRYTGNWQQFFTELGASDADLLTTTLQPHRDCTNWYWWPTLKTPNGTAPESEMMYRSFLPIARLSNRLVRALHDAYSMGWCGHYEAVWPTICCLKQYRMEEIGGLGALTPEGRKGKFYISNPTTWNMFPGTFVYRPSFNDRDIEEYGSKLTQSPMLWHPVKTF